MATVARAWPLLVAVLVTGAGPAADEGAIAGPKSMSAPWREFSPRDRSEQELPDGWFARIATSEGEILVLLHPKQAPQSVAWFAAAADGRLPWNDPVTGESHRAPYYDGLLVHRAVAGLAFEAGDPHGTGRGAPQAFVPFERGPMDFSTPWRVGNASAGVGRISALQFFVTAAARPALSTRTPCFGTVVRGKETVFRITSVKTYPNGRPIQPVTIETIRIERKGSPPDLEEPEPYTPVRQELRPREELIQR